MQNGPLVTTKKTCLPSVMKIEQAYLANLESAAAAGVEDKSGSLVIKDADGAPALLTFAREKPRQFSGSSWRPAFCTNGSGGVVSVLKNTSVNITFDEEGNLAGLAGCNSYWGTYATEDKSFRLAPLVPLSNPARSRPASWNRRRPT